MLVMGCAVLYAIQIIYIARYAGKYSIGALSCLQVVLGGVLSAIAVPILNVTGMEHFFVRFTFQMEFGVIVTAIFTTALAYPMLVWGQTHTTATNTALILTCEPVFAAITSFVVLHERLGARSLAGAALILGGIVRGGMERRNSICGVEGGNCGGTVHRVNVRAPGECSARLQAGMCP